MMKKWILRILSTLLVIGWMFVIFGYSGQQGEESAGLSAKVSHAIVVTVDHVFQKNWSDANIADYAQMIEFPVRKCAHMTEYAILSWLVFWMYGCYGMRLSKKRYLLAILFIFAYAGTDEFHQTFIPGRSGNFVDVCIDTSGAILAMLVLWAIISIRKNQKNKKDIHVKKTMV